MNETFYAYSMELNLPTNDNVVDGEVECHDYTVTYDEGKITTFSAIEEVTGKKYIWQCSCKFDDLTEEDLAEIIDYHEQTPQFVVTLEDWWKSQVKMRYVGYFETKRK